MHTGDNVSLTATFAGIFTSFAATLEMSEWRLFYYFGGQNSSAPPVPKYS